MKVQNTLYNIVYPKVSNLRRKVFELEDKLANSFTVPFSLLPIPDDAPDEIPRISARSHLGHSVLNISQNTTQFATNYDDNFQGDWSKCSDYIKRRVEELYTGLNSFLNGDFLFSGLTTNLVLDHLEGNPIDIIKRHLVNLQSEAAPFDLEYKVTFTIEERYYINITFKNLRMFEGLAPAGSIGIPPLTMLKEKAHMLGVTLDINDRYGFNFTPNYRTNSDQVLRIIDITGDIVEHKLNTMVMEGVFSL